LKKNTYYFLIPFIAVLVLKYFDSFSVSEQITGVDNALLVMAQMKKKEVLILD